MSIDRREYEVTGVVGEGAFAIVQRCRHRDTGEIIAVKSLRRATRDNADYQDRLRREIALLQRLQDVDGVVELLGHSEDLVGPSVWYAMPVAEMNLHRFVQRNNTNLDEQQRVALFRRVLRAIQSAHDRGVLHRDISPSNVLVLDPANCDSVVVCDFGLGRDLESESNRTRSSVDNYGHAYYVAPEQRDSLKDATAQSDVYSLGKLLNFIMTGRDPDHHHRCPYSPVIRRATEPDADARHPTVTHFAEHFDRIETVRTEPAPSDGLLGIALDANMTEPQWEQVHSALIDPNYEDHAYYGYIEPVITFLSSGKRLREYCEAVGAESARFARTFVDEMRDCMRTVGWPFRAMNGFASFLGDVFHVTTDPETRGLCLAGLWAVAYGADQWDAQRLLIGILRSGAVGDDETMILADHILEECMAVGDEDLFDDKIPAPIRNAVRQTGAKRPGTSLTD